jgi:anti-anti-sigma regulatory factor
MPESPDSIKIPTIARLAEAEALVKQILDKKANEQIVFDCSQVNEVGTACVLAIASAIKLREGSHQKVVAIGPPDQLVEAFTDLGLFQDLMKLEFRT